ncbi:MAG: baseplate J/gp47 family protein [Methanosarcinales archaeon]|nr:baseplate J/gp47 family protein [Methanosarcinales archaeon]
MQYFCSNEHRRTLVAKDDKLNGIDYLEVQDKPDMPIEQRQCTLFVHFIKKLESTLTRENIHIEGGERIRDISINNDPSINDNVLVVQVNKPGDFSTYMLRLVDKSAQDNKPPDGFDPVLSAIEFSFKVNCPGDFDCKPAKICKPKKLQEPLIDYMVKDYASFRRLLLDRLSAIMPDWKERNPADLGIALVDILAYTADYLSYYQDAVATEAYLGTARKRVSVRRHARLLDYLMHDGCNARAWVQVQVDGNNIFLKKRTPLLTRLVGYGYCIEPESYEQDLAQRHEVFETLHDIILYKAHNEMHFYTWSDEQCCLPKGTTKTWLCDNGVSRLCLRPGDVVIFEERVGLNMNHEADANRAHRHAVRLTRVHPEASDNGNVRSPGEIVMDPLTDQAYVEIEWDTQDALPFPLCISAEINGKLEKHVGIACGNIVLTDHGRMQHEETLTDLKLEHGPLTQQGRVHDRKNNNLVLFDPRAPASHAFRCEPHDALPYVELSENGEKWTVQRDLLNSSRFARDFVVEMDEGGYARLRFDKLRRPPASSLKAAYRTGNGSAGNIGAEAIVHVITTEKSIIRVRNPLPAQGGIDKEPIEQVRLFAPQAFRTQKRAVTEADYTEITQQYSEVQKAVATLRWTGSWYTMFINVDRRGGRQVDNEFKNKLYALLEPFRMAGYDIEIKGSQSVPLDIAMTVCVAPGYSRSDVKIAILEAFSSVDLPDGRRGFFHPDNFTFGQPVYLSRVITAAMKVQGVQWVDMDDRYPKRNRFRRWRQPSQGEFEDGRISMGRLEIACLDNDLNRPEMGRIEFYMEGGL